MLEVCIDSVESAVAAREGGADRLELCAALVIGGLSPTPALYEAVRRRVDLPVRAMVRPRFGDFLYTDAAKEVMLAEARAWRALGVEGVAPVTGCTAFHMSGKITLESGMSFRREGVPMGLPGLDEYSIWRTDAVRVRAAREVM